MDISALLPAQAQYVTSIGFFVVFLSLSLSLAWVLLAFKLRAGDGARPAWVAAYRLWVRVFALAFVLMLASSVPVMFQLGMLWPTLMARIGNVLGPPLAFAVVTLFVFKSCFLGVMLFGQRRVSARMHTFAVAMVAVGLTILAAWLTAIESWLHVPQGAVLTDGSYVSQDWLQILFNVAMPWHLLLFVAGSLLAAASLILGVTAWQALRRPLDDGEKAAFRAGLVIGAVAFVLLLPGLAGTAIVAARYEPVLSAAVAGYWESSSPVRLVLWGWPDALMQSNRAEVSVPMPGSGWLGVDAGGQTIGLDHYSGMAPPVAAVFWLARLGWLMMGLSLLSMLVCRIRRADRDPRSLSIWWLRTLAGLSFAGVLTVLAGFLVLELGRHPYAVMGTVTWSESLGADLHPAWVTAGAAGQLLLYLVLTGVFIRMMFRAARYGVVPVRKMVRPT